MPTNLKERKVFWENKIKEERNVTNEEWRDYIIELPSEEIQRGIGEWIDYVNKNAKFTPIERKSNTQSENPFKKLIEKMDDNRQRKLAENDYNKVNQKAENTLDKSFAPADNNANMQLSNLQNQTSTKSINDFANADVTKTLKKPSSDEVVYSAPNLLPIFRKDVIKNNEQGFNFTPAENSAANSEKSPYEFSSFSEVAKNNNLIDSLSKKHNVDSDLVKAIMYMETTRGQYDRIIAPLDLNKTVRPMNVNTVYWGNTFGTRKELKTNPAKNIEAGIKMLKSIINNVQPNATIAQIATLYNSINATKVNDYGARVQEIYDKKLWEQK